LFRPVLQVLFIELVVVQVLGTVVALVLLSKLLNRLAAEHHGVWQSLGSATLVRNSNLKSNLAIIRWLCRREYQSLDAATARLGTILRNLGLALLVNTVVVLALFAAIGGHFTRAPT
jgi:hypothetical protein